MVVSLGRVLGRAGHHYIDDAHIDGKPLECHMTPLDWLRAGCRGTVMLGIAEGYRDDDGVDAVLEHDLLEQVMA